MFVRSLFALFFTCLLGQLAHADTVEFALRDLDNKTVNHGDFEGQVVLLSFWATWCGPCKEEMPHLENMYNEYKDEGLVVLSVNTDDARSQSQVKPYIKRQGYTFTVVKDTQSKLLASQNPSKTLPFTVIVGRDGQVAHRIAGYNPGDEKQVEGYVLALLRGETTAAAPEDATAETGAEESAADAAPPKPE